LFRCPISVSFNAIQTIDNEASLLLISIVRIEHDGNLISKEWGACLPPSQICSPMGWGRKMVGVYGLRLDSEHYLKNADHSYGNCNDNSYINLRRNLSSIISVVIVVCLL
jgi:hypothetical protein